MTKKNFFLFAAAIVLAGVYVFYFTDWFRPKIIHISSINSRRILRARNPRDDSPAVPVFFKLGRPCKLTEIKVVVVDEWQTNNDCLPLWHLVAGTNSAPITEPFLYGDYVPGNGMNREYYIHGMKPAVPGMRAKPLQPGVKYRIFVTDGSAKGQHDFQPIAKPAATGQ
jgi:hypothetical protein